jgi:hypothetical protein
MKELNDKLIESYDRILKLDRDKLFETVPGHSVCKDSLNYDYSKHAYYSKFNASWDLDYTWGHVLNHLSTSLNRSKKRAKTMKFTHNLTLPYLVELWIAQKGRCAISGLALDTSRGTNWDKNPLACSIDRIDSNIGYEQGNVRLLTHWVNNAMNTWPDNVFEYFIESYVKNKESTYQG